MQLICSADFYEIAASLGVGRHPDYPHSEHLVYQQHSQHARFWTYPEAGRHVPLFARSLRMGLGRFTDCWLHVRRGRWQSDDLPESSGVQTWNTLIGALGVPVTHVGAVGFRPAEQGQLEALLFLIMTLGPGAFADTMLLTDRGDLLLYFEHHFAVHGQCRTATRLSRIVRHLARDGYPLPTALPDGTFRPVSWMTKAATGNRGA